MKKINLAVEGLTIKLWVNGEHVVSKLTIILKC